MPTLQQSTSKRLDPTKFEPAAPVTRQMPTPPEPVDVRNTMIRCPLPALSATPDALRQFTVPGIPQNRVLAPTQPVNGSGVAGTTSTSVLVSGSSGSSSSGASAALQNASVTTTQLSQNQTYQGVLTLSRIFAITKVVTSAPARIRLYSTSADMVADASRAATTPIQPGTQSGLIAELLLTASSELNWTCSPIILGFNGDNPTAPVAYVSISNPVATSQKIPVSFSYLPLLT
jgi:hypothetical protein